MRPQHKTCKCGGSITKPLYFPHFPEYFYDWARVTHEPKCSPRPFLFCDLYATSLQTETAVYEEVGTHRKSSQRFQISLQLSKAISKEQHSHRQKGKKNDRTNMARTRPLPIGLQSYDGTWADIQNEGRGLHFSSSNEVCGE